MRTWQSRTTLTTTFITSTTTRTGRLQPSLVRAQRTQRKAYTRFCSSCLISCSYASAHLARTLRAKTPYALPLLTPAEEFQNLRWHSSSQLQSVKDSSQTYDRQLKHTLRANIPPRWLQRTNTTWTADTTAMGEREVDFEAEAKADSKSHIKKADNALTIDIDLSHARKRSALYARRKDAGQQTTQTRSAKLRARSSSLHVTLQVDSRPWTFQYTSQNTKAVSTPASTTREAGEKKKTARIAITTTAPAISNTLNTSSLRSNALQIRHSCIRSLATTYTAKTHRQHQHHSSCLRTATRDLCIKEFYRIQAPLTYLQLARSSTSRWHGKT